MIHGTLQWAAEAMKGRLEGGDAAFSGVGTDTRSLKKDEIFFCLVGKTDGHVYVDEALRKGASAVVVDQNHREIIRNLTSRAPVLIVQDTLKALGDLAHAWRKTFSIPIVAIGGSNGKTTTKNLTRGILAQRWKTLATEANFNNLIGVPWTIFRLGPEHQAAVLELGMNDFGELRRLTEIAQPTAGLLTNIGLEHLEKLKDLSGVIRAEEELFTGLSEDAVALVNLADPHIAKMRTHAKKLYYGTAETPIWGKLLRSGITADRPLHLEIHVEGEKAELALKLPGPHNLSNVLAAIAIARHLGVSLAEAKQALEEFHPSASRMELVELSHGVRLIDDCYNSNPSSAVASLQTLARIRDKGKTFAILGEMLELGEYSVRGHHEVGQAVGQEKIDYLMAIGPHAPALLEGALAAGMASDAVQAFGETDEAVRHLKKLPKDVRWILVKGSRGVHLEKIVQHLKERF
jgi:UDP-N-acetylmuramoyl-tripeptide--D-alanyl-D-alanine ligase